MAMKMTSAPKSTHSGGLESMASDAIKGEKAQAKEAADLQPRLEFQLKTTNCDLCYPHCHVFYMSNSYQNIRGGQGMKDWRKFQKARLNSTTGIAQSHFHFTTWKAYGHWVIIGGVDNQQLRNTRGQWERRHIRIWSWLCRGQLTRQPRKDVKKEGKKNHADRAQDQCPPQCRYHHNFKYLYGCRQNYISSYRHEASKSPAKDKSAPNAEEGRTRGKLAKTVVSGSLPATRSEQETGTKYFKGLSSAHRNYLHYLCNMGVLFFYLNIISFW